MTAIQLVKRKLKMALKWTETELLSKYLKIWTFLALNCLLEMLQIKRKLILKNKKCEPMLKTLTIQTIAMKAKQKRNKVLTTLRRLVKSTKTLNGRKVKVLCLIIANTELIMDEVYGQISG